MNEIAIRVENLSKRYKLYDRMADRLKEAIGMKVKAREHYALNNVSFTINRGETVGIIGTNGSGKSTILKIITGVVSPTSGQVVVDGRISALLELGAGFNQEYTGLENVYLNGTMIGFTKEEIDARLDEILRFADIGDFINQPVKTYSSGMFVRLAFAIAINIDPDILIVDEALSVGDVFFQAKCYHKFEDFKRRGKTILFVSHDLNSISKYCDRVILLNKGDVLEIGEPKQVVNRYKQLLVKRKEQVQMKAMEEYVSKDRLNRPFDKNPNVLEYGGREAMIVDFTIEDSNGVPGNTIQKMDTFTIRERVHFNEDVDEVIYTYTIKDLRGTEITGTNTMFEKIPVEPQKKGNTQEITFTQVMNLQGGEYLLSLGCTGYRGGEFVVYHRLYDVCSISVVSSKNTVGFFDMDSQITVTDI